MVQRYKNILTNEFHGYDATKLLKDILAGITVGAVSLPLALAFGAACVGEEYAAIGISAGLITAIFAGLITGLFGGSSFQISGPTGTMTAVLGFVIAKYGLQGMFLTCLMAGFILILAGLFRLGKLIQFIPHPVVIGFTSGIAVVIALGQVGNLFGVSLKGETILEKIIDLFKNKLTEINAWAVVFTLLVIVIMCIYPKKWSKIVPGSLVAIILITVISFLTQNIISIKTIGSIPSSLINDVHLEFSKTNFNMLKGVISSSFSIAALIMIESLLCGTCASNMKKEKFDSNLELIAQGIVNVVIPFFGAVPSTAALARTSVAIKSGGQTRLTGVFQSLFLITCMFLLSGLIGFVPYSALAGVLIVTAWRMNEWSSIKEFFRNKMWDAITMFLITMFTTVLLDLTYAIIIGVIAGIFIMVSKLTYLDIDQSVYEAEKTMSGKRTSFIYVTGALFFANVNEIAKYIEHNTSDCDEFVFVFRGVVYLDVTAVKVLKGLVEKIHKDGKEVKFTCVRDSVLKTLRHSGLMDIVGQERFYETIDKLFRSRYENDILNITMEIDNTAS